MAQYLLILIQRELLLMANKKYFYMCFEDSPPEIRLQNFLTEISPFLKMGKCNSTDIEISVLFIQNKINIQFIEVHAHPKIFSLGFVTFQNGEMQ